MRFLEDEFSGLTKWICLKGESHTSTLYSLFSVGEGQLQKKSSVNLNCNVQRRVPHACPEPSPTSSAFIFGIRLKTTGTRASCRIGRLPTYRLTCSTSGTCSGAPALGGMFRGCMPLSTPWSPPSLLKLRPSTSLLNTRRTSLPSEDIQDQLRSRCARHVGFNSKAH